MKDASTSYPGVHSTLTASTIPGGMMTAALEFQKLRRNPVRLLNVVDTAGRDDNLTG
jgi:hypothetical protein